MRINKYIASATGMSRRAADSAIADGRVRVNSQNPSTGYTVQENDAVTLDGHAIALPQTFQTILLNKPSGYVCSRDGQGNKTIYDLIPHELHALKPIGRLDKNSSGLLLMTTDGALAHELTHPSRQKTKVYEIRLSTPLAPLHRQMIADFGVMLDDGPSKFEVERIADDEYEWRITMHEGRNRQIRRTFDALGYTVIKLHRTNFGTYKLGGIEPGTYVAAQ